MLFFIRENEHYDPPPPLRIISCRLLAPLHPLPSPLCLLPPSVRPSSSSAFQKLPSHTSPSHSAPLSFSPLVWNLMLKASTREESYLEPFTCENILMRIQCHTQMISRMSLEAHAHQVIMTCVVHEVSHIRDTHRRLIRKCISSAVVPLMSLDNNRELKLKHNVYATYEPRLVHHKSIDHMTKHQASNNSQQKNCDHFYGEYEMASSSQRSSREYLKKEEEECNTEPQKLNQMRARKTKRQLSNK